jgi:hypothetical protein
MHDPCVVELSPVVQGQQCGSEPQQDGVSPDFGCIQPPNLVFAIPRKSGPSTFLASNQYRCQPILPSSASRPHPAAGGLLFPDLDPHFCKEVDRTLQPMILA